MRFSQAQVLKFAGLTKEALRHWKTALSPIAGRDARSADYTIGELLTLSALAEANRNVGISVSAIAPFAEQLFKLVEEDLAAVRVPRPVALTGAGIAQLERESPLSQQSLFSMAAILVISFDQVCDRLWDEFGLPQRRQPTRQFELPV